jgi:hypothetical protein
MRDMNAVMAHFGVTENTLSKEDKRSLDEDGFLILMPDDTNWPGRGIDLSHVRRTLDALVAKEQWRGGIESKEDAITKEKPLDPGSNRIANLIDKHSVFRKFVSHPKILAAVAHVIGDQFKCSALDLRSPQKGGGEQQLHIDWLPRMNNDDPFECVFVGIHLDGMKIENGALRILPKTHHNLDWPNEYINVLERHPDEVRVELPPGAAVVANGLVWHGGAVNTSGEPRRSLYVDYRQRHIPQLLNQKRYLSADTISSLSDAEKYLLAVRDEDPTDDTKGLGPGEKYRARYGNKYLPIEEVRGEDSFAQ